jgi:hypothetical protein
MPAGLVQLGELLREEPLILKIDPAMPGDWDEEQCGHLI